MYHDHHAGQPLCDHRLQYDFRLSTTRLNAFGPSGQARLISIDAGAGDDDITLDRQQDLGFRPGGHGLSPRQQPPNSGSLYSMGQCGTAHDAGEAVFLRGHLHDSHVPRPQSVTPRPDSSSGLSHFSGALLSHHQSASLQRHGWCSIPYESDPWSSGNVAAGQTVLSIKGTDFTALVRKLTLCFEPVDLASMYQCQLRSQCRKHNESIPELVQEISKLMRKAFPSADEETRNYMSVTSFITALPNEQEEFFSYQRGPKGIGEAGNAAMAFGSF